ncbi:GHMP kinase [Leadbettera azotonutricia]|uniref:Ghmp kinase n=1 Tax=Leadbettera azotonutricia (strain ATCC BAA-888 / DSM 13862 / ZAS-9) TaxID=545695 RepID=F5YAV4_LEAAZ|nr:GHMP kinase [Leadbettera azotonutricia]AEF80070.1 ghmp kinase [Leadbettera azotonutricia ZAS-9]
MIITRTPFRISLCGGGSDISTFYKKNSGFVLSASINKYMYIITHPSFQKDKTVLKYSKTEIVDNLNEIEHIYFKAILQKMDVSGIEITSTADIPAGTGLGSSSSFTVGLLHNLYSYKNKFVSKECLAEEACKIEIEVLKQPIGKQDQYAAAYGGLNFYTFRPDGSVFVEPILMEQSSLINMQRRLMMFYISGTRSASAILEEQRENIKKGEYEKKLIKICQLAQDLRISLQNNEIDTLGKILHESWMLKRSLAEGITNMEIDKYYQIALDNGAIGGKLLGAGSGGFLLLYVPESKQDKVRSAINIPEQKFDFERQGSTIIYIGS